MRKRDHNVFTNAASLLICGLLAGVVVAAAAFPAVAMSGLAAKAGAETFGALPKELTVARAPQISYLLASDGKTPLATMYDENRRTSSSPTSRRTCRRPSSPPRTTTSTSTTASTSTASRGRSSTTSPRHRPAGRVHAHHAVRPAGHRLLGHPPGRRGRRHRGHQRPQAPRDAVLRSRSTRSSPRTRSWSATSTSPRSATARTASTPPARSTSASRPSKLKIEEAALLAGMVKAPTTLRPDHQERLPARARTGATTSSRTWSRPSAITQARGRRRQGGQAGGEGQAHPERLRRRPTTTPGASSATTSTAGGSSRRRSARPRTTASGG